MADLARRDLLRGAGALAASPVVARWPVRHQAGDVIFAWGVASFDPAPSSVLLWTRASPPAGGGQVLLFWAIATDEAMTDATIVRSGRVAVDSATDHCAVVDVDGLEPGRTWWYRFEAPGGSRSPVGRTRTLPAGPVERARLGVVSCSRFASGGFAAYRALGEREVDLVVHLGDYIYEDGVSGTRPHEPAERLTTVAAYRARYAQHRADGDLQALHARHPMVAVWDDHDIAGGAWRDGAGGHDPTRDGAWAERLAAATQAREDWLPGRTDRDGDGRIRMWRSLPLGDLAELVLLDTRSRREHPPTTAAELDAARASGLATILGDEQAAFLAGRLDDAARPPWVLLGNQVMVHPLRLPVPTDALVPQLEDAGFLVVDDGALNPDQWDGYPGAREELVSSLGTQGGVVVLTGDVHSSWAWEGPAAVDGEPAMVELVTPSVSTEPLLDRLPVPPAVAEAGLHAVDTSLSFVEVSSHGYLVVDLDADSVEGQWWHVDRDDPASERLAAVRRAPRTVPMRLEEADEARPAPTTTAPAPSVAPGTSAPAPEVEDDGGDLPVVPVGVAAAVLSALAAAALRVRRRP